MSLIAVALLFVDAAVWVRGWTGLPTFAGDFMGYQTAAASWLAGTGFYLPYQLAGSYDVWSQSPQPILYPPVFLVLMAPFVVLPAVLWWAIPLGIIGWFVARAPRSRWLLIAALVMWPPTLLAVWVGNPNLWILAILCLATRWAAFAPWVLLKPSLFPVALYRINRRAWWAGLAALGLASAAFGPMWLDYVKALQNAQQSAGLLYSAAALPMLLIAGQVRRNQSIPNRSHVAPLVSMTRKPTFVMAVAEDVEASGVWYDTPSKLNEPR